MFTFTANPFFILIFSSCPQKTQDGLWWKRMRRQISHKIVMLQIQLGCRANRSKPVTFEVGGNSWITRMWNYRGYWCLTGFANRHAMVHWKKCICININASRRIVIKLNPANSNQMWKHKTAWVRQSSYTTSISPFFLTDLRAKRRYLYTVEPRFNEPLYAEVLGITNDILQPGQSYSEMYGTEPRYNEPRYNEILDITNLDITKSSI